MKRETFTGSETAFSYCMDKPYVIFHLEINLCHYDTQF